MRDVSNEKVRQLTGFRMENTADYQCMINASSSTKQRRLVRSFQVCPAEDHAERGRETSGGICIAILHCKFRAQCDACKRSTNHNHNILLWPFNKPVVTANAATRLVFAYPCPFIGDPGSPPSIIDCKTSTRNYLKANANMVHVEQLHNRTKGTCNNRNRALDEA
jgi:hypothetical protein